MRFDNRALTNEARSSLAGTSYDHRRTVLIHAGAACLANVLVALLAFWMDRQIGTTGGIGGADRRALLTTVKTTAQVLLFFFLLFWSFSYTSISIDLARENMPEKDCLLDGFRNIKSILRLTLLKGFLIGGILFFSIQAASFLFCMTPWAKPLIGFTELYLGSTDYQAMEEALMAVIEEVRLPMMILTCVAFVGLGIPILYRFRLADLVLMEDPSVGALRALTGSARLLRHRCGALLRLDLHFWWYHLPWLLCFLLGNVTFFSYLFGIPLPFDEEIVSLVSVVASSLGIFLLSVWKKNLVRLTYVNAFDLLQKPRRSPTPQPGRQPWKY